MQSSRMSAVSASKDRLDGRVAGFWAIANQEIGCAVNKVVKE